MAKKQSSVQKKDAKNLYVFISYARPDQAIAEQVETYLQAAGVHVFRDTNDIHKGDNWDMTIEKALKEANRMVLLLSGSSMPYRKEVHREWFFFDQAHKPIYPLYIEPCELHSRMVSYNYIDAQGDKLQPALEQVLKELGEEFIPPAKLRVNPLARFFKWLKGGRLLGAISSLVVLTVTIIGLFLADTNNTRCTSFPIEPVRTFFRDYTCGTPSFSNSEEFVVVVGKLLYRDAQGAPASNAVETSRFSDAIYKGLTNIASSIRVIPPTDPWVDNVSGSTNLMGYAQKLADLFRAKLVVYGEIQPIDGEDKLSPCVFMPKDQTNNDLFAIDIRSACGLGSITFLNDSDSGSLRAWIEATNHLAKGLQTAKTAQGLSGSQKTAKLEEALTEFKAVADSSLDGFSALGNIYAGNTALDLAIQKQISFEQGNLPTPTPQVRATPEGAVGPEGTATPTATQERCIPNHCEQYAVSVKDEYRLAWGYYSAALDKTAEDNLRYRALIGRGNVQYRLALLTRTESQASGQSINYRCLDADLLFSNAPDTALPDEHLTWDERAKAAISCYSQASRMALPNSPDQVKIKFGLAQTTAWLMNENVSIQNGETVYDPIFKVADSLDDVDKKSKDIQCIVALGYGERGRLRWGLMPPDGSMLGEVRGDLEKAVQGLTDNKCGLEIELQGYSADLNTLPVS